MSIIAMPNADAYQALRNKGYALAGAPGDLLQRASVYHHLYQDSGSNNVFPLIAAHGALWASGYFRKGMLGGRLLSLPLLLVPGLRRARLAALTAFAERFRDINRRVCAESYALYYYTKQHGADRFIRTQIGDAFADLLAACHHAQARGEAFSLSMREQLFTAFFMWEQEHIVAPSVDAAFASMDWKAIHYLARKPVIRFAYFGKGYALPFNNFALQAERIERGLQAYRRAEQVGLAQVETALGHYKILPQAFHRDPSAYFQGLERAQRGPLAALTCAAMASTGSSR